MLHIEADLKKAVTETMSVKDQLQKARQLHATAHEVVCAFKQKEDAKKKRMVAEHVYSLTYHHAPQGD